MWTQQFPNINCCCRGVIVEYNTCHRARRMKRLLTLVACIFSFHAAAAADLVAVYQRALQNDPQLREAEANPLAALQAQPQALAAWLPTVTGTAIANKDRDTGTANQ